MTESLTAHEVFGFLLPEQVHAISEAAERVKVSAGDLVYQKGDPADHFFTVLGGEITLRLPGAGGMSVVIDQAGKGAMFGSCCIGTQRKEYALTAQCTQDGELLKVKNSALKALMDQDRMMGYHLQGRISEIYFGRYVDTMKKLQGIVMNVPLEMD